MSYLRASICCRALLTALAQLTVFAQSESKVASIYTPLSKDCRTVSQDKETGNSVRNCRGAGRFRLLVARDDDRMSVSLTTQDGHEYPLDYWSVVTRSFSTLGPTAEWRVTTNKGEITPIALIIRVDWSDQTNLQSPAKRSELAVAKITADEICLIGKVPSQGDGKTRARIMADNSQNQPCLKP